MELAGLVVGLGNPGQQYAGTRHNCGFAFIDALLADCQKISQVEKMGGQKFFCELWRSRLPDNMGTWLCAKPQTFMNESGKSVQACCRGSSLLLASWWLSTMSLISPRAKSASSWGAEMPATTACVPSSNTLAAMPITDCASALANRPTRGKRWAGFWAARPGRNRQYFRMPFIIPSRFFIPLPKTGSRQLPRKRNSSGNLKKRPLERIKNKPDGWTPVQVCDMLN